VKDAKQRKPYEKPATVFEKDLEALAGDCDPTGDRVYTGGGEANYCKADGFCTTTLMS
jgi:hypothetical protein